MESGIQITKTKLIFTKFQSKETGLAMQCKSFEIELSEVKFIALSPRLILDDESIFILIVDFNNRVYPIPAHAIAMDGFDIFEKRFKLKSISEDCTKFKDKDHYGKIDKIIYPQDKYWIDLFSKDWKLTLRSFYSWIIPKSFYGNIRYF
ncbi:hypothetical protein [Wenyingzhuangia sp. IMCC45574]